MYLAFKQYSLTREWKKEKLKVDALLSPEAICMKEALELITFALMLFQ